MTKGRFDFANDFVRKGTMTGRLIHKSVTDANARQKAATRVVRAQAFRSQVTPEYRAYTAKADYAVRQAYHAMTARIQAAATMEDS